MGTRYTRLRRRLAARAAEARYDERGSVLSEYGVLLGIMAVAAAAAGAYIVTNIDGWLQQLPLPG